MWEYSSVPRSATKTTTTSASAAAAWSAYFFFCSVKICMTRLFSSYIIIINVYIYVYVKWLRMASGHASSSAICPRMWRHSFGRHHEQQKLTYTIYVIDICSPNSNANFEQRPTADKKMNFWFWHVRLCRRWFINYTRIYTDTVKPIRIWLELAHNIPARRHDGAHVHRITIYDIWVYCCIIIAVLCLPPSECSTSISSRGEKEKKTTPPTNVTHVLQHSVWRINADSARPEDVDLNHKIQAHIVFDALCPVCCVLCVLHHLMYYYCNSCRIDIVDRMCLFVCQSILYKREQVFLLMLNRHRIWHGSSSQTKWLQRM